MKQRPMTGSEALYLSDTNIPAAIEQFKISGDSIDRQLSELGIGTFTPIIEQEPPVVPQPKLPIDELLAQVGVRVSEAESLAASKEATRRFMLDLHVIETRSQHISKFDRLRQFVTKNVARLEMREKVSQTSESLRSMRKSTKRATAAVILLAGISGILIGNNGEADETPTERHVEEQAVVNPALVGKLPKPFTNHSDAPSVSPEITTSETRDNQASNDNLLNDDSLYKSLYANPVETAFNIESLPKDLLPSTLINQITEKFHIDYDFLMSESLRHFSVQMEQQYSLKPDSMIWVQGRIINPTENAAFIKTIVKTASQLVVA